MFFGSVRRVSEFGKKCCYEWDELLHLVVEPCAKNCSKAVDAADNWSGREWSLVYLACCRTYRDAMMFLIALLGYSNFAWLNVCLGSCLFW